MRRTIVVAKCIAAGVLISVGVVLIPLPGPGTPLILAGLAVLATEFAWAAAVQERAVDFMKSLGRRVWAART